MKLTPLNKYCATNIDLEAQSELELPTEGAAKAILMNMIISNQYSDPLKAACREALQNALDANKEAGNQHLPIIINLPTKEEPQLTISDNGKGIDAERFHNVYRKIGHSTKSNDNEFMGGYGMGRLSMLAVASQVLINSVSAGIYYQHSAYIKESGNIGFATFSSQPTDKPSGTQIVIPIDTKDHLEVNKHIKELTTWVEQPVKVYHNGELCNNIQNTSDWSLKGCYKDCPWYLKFQNCINVEVTILQSDLPYQLSGKLYTDLKDHFKNSVGEWNLTSGIELKNNLVIRMPVGSLELTQSRESLRINEFNKKALEFIPPLLEHIKEKLEEALLSQPSLREVIRTFFLNYPFSSFEFRGRQFTRQNYSYYNAYSLSDYRRVFPEKCTLIWGSEETTKNALRRCIAKLSKATSPLIYKCTNSILPFLDCVWVVYPEGTTKVKLEFKIRQALNIPTSKHILCIPTNQDPEEYIKTHPLFSLLEDVLVYKPIQKERKYNSKPTTLKSLIKGGSARTLLSNAGSLSQGVYNCTEKVFELPDSGIYVKTDEAKTRLGSYHIPKWLDQSTLFFVSDSIAERLKENPQWKSFSDYSKEQFTNLVNTHRKGLELLDWSVDSTWVSGDCYFCGLPCNEFLAKVIKKSMSATAQNSEELSLVNLLLHPDQAFWLSKAGDSFFVNFSKESEESKKLQSIKNKLKNNRWSLGQYQVKALSTTLSVKPYYTSPNEYAALKVPIFKKLADKYPLLMLLIQNVEIGTEKPTTKENLPLAERNLLESIEQYMEQINAIHN